MEARVSQSDPTQAFTLSNQTLHCIAHGQTSKLARTRWLCSGAGQVVRPSSQVQAGADSGGVFYRIRSYCRWAVASLPAKVCCLRGQLPRVVVGPASADTLVRPTKTEFAANTGTRVAQHGRPAALMYGGVPAGRGQRTGGLQQQLGPALQQRATSCHLRQQTTSGPAADSCRLIVTGEYLRAPGQHSCACVLSSRESVDTWSLSRRRETTCSRVEMPEEGCLLCCSAVHQVCLLAIL